MNHSIIAHHYHGQRPGEKLTRRRLDRRRTRVDLVEHVVMYDYKAVLYGRKDESPGPRKGTTSEGYRE